MDVERLNPVQEYLPDLLHSQEFTPKDRTTQMDSATSSRTEPAP